MFGLPLVAVPGPALAAPPKRMIAYKTPWCGCCGGWIAHMRQAGWIVEVVEREDLAPIRARRAELVGDPGHLLGVLREGNARANAIADATLAEVRQAMGMVY